MNPKRTMAIGAMVLMLAMCMIPCASALTVNQERFEAVPGLANSETYALTVDENIIYVAGVQWYDKVVTLDEWKGVGFKATRLAEWDAGDYIYYPTDVVKFDGQFYISLINWSSPDGNGVFETPLLVYDPDSGDIDVAETFLHGMIGQMTVFGDYLVAMADYNAIEYTDDGTDWDEKLVVDDIQLNYTDDGDTYYYLYDIHNLGITTMGNDLYLESRNCTWKYVFSSFMNLGGDEPLAPQTYDEYVGQSIDFHSISDIDDEWTNEVTTHSLSRILNWKSTLDNITNPLYTLPNDESFAFTADNAAYISDDTFSYTRVYNGDTLRNVEPIYAGKLGADGKYKPNSLLVNTINAADNAPSCPDPIALPDLPERMMTKPQPVKVYQGIDASSVIPTGRDTFEVDVKTGTTTFVFTNSVQIVWDEVDFIKGSIVLATTSGVFTYHWLTIDLTGVINSLMLALLILGIVFVVFGIATWNKGFEDVLSLSLGGGLLAGAAMLFIYPAIYLSWLLLLLPVVAFFVILYYCIKTYNLHKLDFRVKGIDAVWIIAILAVFIAIELYCGWLSNTFYPAWLPAP